MDEQAPFQLSAWQQKAIKLTSDIIKMKVLGMEEGPRYIPMPTGAGKTTGAIEAIVDLLEAGQDCRFCFLTPYRDSVEDVYQKLVARLGETRVGYYHWDGEMGKEEALEKDVVVLTHQFLPYGNNRELLADRNLFIIDEAIFANETVSLKLSAFATAMEWARQHGVMVDAFEAAYAYANFLDQQMDRSEEKFLPPIGYAEQDWAKELLLNFDRQSHRQSYSAADGVEDVLTFTEALTSGLAFLSKKKMGSKKEGREFVAASLFLPSLKDTIVLTATGGLSYDIAGPFAEADGTKGVFDGASYERVKLVELPLPTELPKMYAEWAGPKAKPLVVAYFRWVLEQVEENEIYLTMPKKVLDGCLRQELGLAANTDLPATVELCGKKIHVSHHAISIGTNKFKDCRAVVYLWDNHLPQSAAVQRVTALEDEPVDDEKLVDANKEQLFGRFAAMRDVAYLDNILQQLGRGNMRNIDDEGKAGEMTAYLCCDPRRAVHLRVHLKGHSYVKLSAPQFVSAKLSSTLDRVRQYLMEQPSGRTISGKEVEKALDIRLRDIKERLIGDPYLDELGYEFIEGRKGRGNGPQFRWIG